MSRTTISGKTGKNLFAFPDSTCLCYCWGFAIFCFGSEELREKCLDKYAMESGSMPYPTLAYKADQETSRKLADFLLNLQDYKIRFLLWNFIDKGWWEKSTTEDDLRAEFNDFGKYLSRLKGGWDSAT